MLRTSFALSLALLLGACVLDPLSGSSVPPASAEVAFRGIAAYRSGLRVRVEVQEADGRFTLLGEAAVARNGSWAARVTVPERAWRLPPCDAARFRFRGTDGAQVLGQDGECVRAAGPDATVEQRLACLVPYVEIFRGQVHVGDLSITGQAEADAQACVTVVDGNLALDGGAVPTGSGYAPGLGFAMPNLEEVRGDLAIDGGRTESFSLPRLERVGGDLALRSWQFPAPGATGGPAPGYGVNGWDLPLVAEVGGDVELTSSTDGPARGRFIHDFDLDALTTVGGSVAVRNDGFIGTVTGLRGLVGIPVDLALDPGPGDLDGGTDGLLTALVSVGRDANLDLPSNASRALVSLEVVGRDLSISPSGSAPFTALGAGPDRSFLPSLRSVGRDLVLDRAAAFCGAGILGALERVTGTLRMTGYRPEGPMGRTGASPLVIGGLDMASTDSAVIPLHDDVSVSGKGIVRFTGNANLCPCQIAAFAAGLAARGWGGAPASTGNGTAASCSPCPAPTCP